ncbi:L-rhamnose-binding lectin CSL3-like [Ciona intestinalis]
MLLTLVSVAVCEGRRRSIRCRANYVISVHAAYYGRTDSSTCRRRNTNIQSTSCSSTSSNEIIKDACQGQNGCRLDARSSIFGDPCRGTPKYIYMSYTCIYPTCSNPIPTVRVICERQRRIINCGTGKRIGVLTGFYGRTNKLTCPSRTIRSTRCKSRSSFRRIHNTCHGKQRCAITATNTAFGMHRCIVSNTKF